MKLSYEEAINFLKKELNKLSNIDQESFWILEFITGKNKINIISEYSNILTDIEYSKLLEIISKRKKRYPLQYILEKVFLFKDNFFVEEGVLIPREETELIIEYVINNAKKNSVVLEIGVGSGIISLSIKKYREDISIIATDINKKAIHLSQKNELELFQKLGNIEYKESNLFESIHNIKFDIIVSNPPYLSEEEFKNSEKELFFEPKEALVAKNEGMFFYEEIIKKGLPLLNEKGTLIIEISPLRETGIKNILKKYSYINTQILKDFSNQSRVIIIQKV